MKEASINKIRNFGKIGNIVAIVAKVIIIIGIVAIIGSGIFFAVIPKDFITVDVASKATVIVDGERMGKVFGEEITDEKIDSLNQELEDEMAMDMKLNNTNYAVASVSKDGNNLVVDTEVDVATFELNNLMWVAVAGLFSLIVGLVVAIFAGRLCKAFRDCETPFEENIIKKMKQLGYAMIPMAIVPSITDSLANSVMMGKVDISASVDLAVVLAIVIVFALAYVFKYGAVLQQESDETL
ncbi:MAG: DUF2975 domain-containing protein [Lachnospira sp.]|nr:DUF2975 domain-containing protein [Lachnospira sp.]